MRVIKSGVTETLMKTILCLILLFSAGAASAQNVTQLAKEATDLSVRGDYLQAREKFEQAIKLDSSNATLHQSLGLACQKLGLYQEAVKSLETAVSLDYGLIQAHNSLALLYEAMALQQSGQSSAAEWRRKAHRQWSAAASLEKDPAKLDMAKKHLARIESELK